MYLPNHCVNNWTCPRFGRPPFWSRFGRKNSNRLRLVAAGVVVGFLLVGKQLAELLMWPSPSRRHGRLRLLADDFYQHSFLATAVELAIENLFPRTEVESSLGDRDGDVAPHNLALVMRIGVIFAGAIVMVALG